MSEDLPVDEVIGALEEYQRRTIDLYREHADDPEACVKGLVRLHLGWTEEDPERAKMVSRYRGEVMAGPGRERLSASNAAYFAQSKEWMETSRNSGAMPSVSFNVLHALVFAPTQELCKHWLGGRLKKQPTEYADAMGDAAWAGILAAGAALQTGQTTAEKRPG
ncbi:MAG TPA: hypothetical protein PKA56_02095 [Solirubrobacterales bacterium]|jgi:hypothetical protein|nr:hypothetical protein [Solirubrobacterales bacterium]HMU26860.1 hypothetical protein [Solirubrobacterales bacterium]HMW45775.1 hypothetical protein [Solirubrobacterales bacterium]HMX70526.1 hypothetical protein [Solirubrobacterales bacterium]HMY26216.1 hypothetical protein [Solirubrobacterales bacterium]